MNVFVIDSLKKLSQIEDDWKNLIIQNETSLFLTYDYTMLLWEHFSEPSDQLLILAVQDNGRIVGIAPFKIGWEKMYGIPVRTIRFISQWESDRPDILTSGDENEVWQAIHDYLDNVFTKWHIAEFAEQEKTSPVMKRKFFHSASYYKDVSESSVSYFISLEQSWEQYFARLTKKVRKSYKYRLNKTKKLPGGMEIEHFNTPDDILDGLQRHITIEEESWKKQAGIGIGQTPKYIRFYNDVLKFLSKEGCACISIMKTGDVDIASMLVYKFHNVIYGVQIAYKYEFSKCSPGVILRAEMLKSLFNSSYQVLDMMGMSHQQPEFKSSWATHSNQTYRIQVFKKKLRILPLIAGKKMKKASSSLSS